MTRVLVHLVLSVKVKVPMTKKDFDKVVMKIADKLEKNRNIKVLKVFYTLLLLAILL